MSITSFGSKFKMNVSFLQRFQNFKQFTLVTFKVIPFTDTKRTEKVLLVFMKSLCNGAYSLPISLYHETVSAGRLVLRQ